MTDQAPKRETAGPLTAAIAEGLHHAMCFGPSTLHNRLACERPQVYLSIAEVVVTHPAVRDLVEVQNRSTEAAFGALSAVGDDLTKVLDAERAARAPEPLRATLEAHGEPLEHALHFDPACEECAYLARPVVIHRKVAQSEAAWLIERGQPEKQMPTLWWVGDNRWTDDAFKAMRFESREAAEGVIASKFTPPPSRGGPSARAVEHGFIPAHGEPQEGEQ